jgi:hypothetical protein
VDAHIGGLEAQNEALCVYIPLVADSHHFEEEVDLDRKQSEKLGKDPHLSKSKIRSRFIVKSWIRIRIKVMLIRNPAQLGKWKYNRSSAILKHENKKAKIA